VSVYAMPDQHFTLTLEREHLETGPFLEPNPDWSFTDEAGHVHTYGPKFSTPTLEDVWVEGTGCCCCCDSDGDYEKRCKICGEVIYPGTRYNPGETILGLQSCYGTLTQDHPEFERLLESFYSQTPFTLCLSDSLEVSGVLCTEYQSNYDGPDVANFIGNEVIRRSE